MITNLNNKIEQEANFVENGIFARKNFLSLEKVNKILEDCENIFQNKLDNSALGAQATTFFPGLYSISCPTLSINFNFLELAIDIFDVIKTLDKNINQSDYELTNIDILKDNNNELMWHTDNTTNMYRAFIYLQGGSDTTGAFRQMIGTHSRDYTISHELDETTIIQKNLNEKIVTCDYPVGSLIISDINGFHSNCKKETPRIIVIFDFIKKKSSYNKSIIPIKANHLTQKVLENLDLFKCNGSEENRNHGIEKRLNSIGNTTKPDKKLIKSVARYYRDKLKILLKKK